jgi:hypothetical protein
MVPPATGASLHHIGGVLVARALQLVDIAGIGDAFSVLGKSVAEDIGNENNVHLFADGANGL